MNKGLQGQSFTTHIVNEFGNSYPEQASASQGQKSPIKVEQCHMKPTFQQASCELTQPGTFAFK